MKTNKIIMNDMEAVGIFIVFRDTFFDDHALTIQGLHRKRKFRPHTKTQKIKWILRQKWKDIEWVYDEV